MCASMSTSSSAVSKKMLSCFKPLRPTLHGASESTQKIEREDVGLRTRDFAMDPSQDLIAFVAFEIVGT